MTRPLLELLMIRKYWIIAKHAPISEFTENDIRVLENLRAEISEKICAIRRDNLKKIALCDDPMTTTPRPSICGRCGVISPAPDGSGYMCGLNLRALEEFGFNSDYPNTLASPKINPLSEHSRTYTAGGTGHE